MKFIKYSKYEPNAFDGLSAEDLLQLLQDFLLDSSFYSQYYNFYEMDPQRTIEQLRQALLEAMQNQGRNDSSGTPRAVDGERGELPELPACRFD